MTKRKSPMDDSSTILHAFATRVVTRVLEKEAATGFEQNVACSPLSLYAMLNMVAAGAGGGTLAQLLEVLGSESVEDLNSVSARLAAIMNGGGGGPHISLVNGVWLDRLHFRFKPSYEEIIKNLYKAEAKAIRFSFPDEVDHVIDEVVSWVAKSTNDEVDSYEHKLHVDRVTDVVNSWVAKSTNNIIKEILKRDMICRDMVLILTNALYFKGAWKHPIDESKTVRNEAFYLLNNETVLVPYMCESSKLQFYSFHKDFQLLKLPYQSGNETRRFSLYIFLPNERNGLNNLIQKYFNTDTGFVQQQFELQKIEIDTLWIPKFKFSFTFKPKEIMQELGLTLPFDQNVGGLTEMVDSLERCFITDVVQKSSIEVNEDGTEEASSATASASIKCPVYRQKEPPSINFIADHPFMFMIREDASGVVFFLGAVVNPLL